MLAKFDLLVMNGLVVTASDISSFDIAIKDGKIHTLAPSFSLEDIWGRAGYRR
ncbi:hypothetical protein B0H16DRAFT_948057 [Mycena metata]|uniref:Uncharacterized protein n=1 Tax=Mycena metata TaxID=1033252 RepID=A0AAD7K5H7_9AGAR|nr:hypothetical protein B0H16DRAFT_948057 [Mycena metata]